MSQEINTAINQLANLDAMNFSPPDSEDERYNFRPPQLGLPNAPTYIFRHPRDNSDAGFMIQDPHRPRDLENVSMAARVSNSSRGMTNHHEILLKWNACITNAKRANVEKKLSKLDMTDNVRIYWSNDKPATYVHLIVKQGHEGFRRNFFAPSMKSRGSNILRKCEIPKSWTTTLWHNDIEKEITDLYDGCCDLNMRGLGC